MGAAVALEEASRLNKNNKEWLQVFEKHVDFNSFAIKHSQTLR